MAPTKKDGEKDAKLTPEQSAALIMDYLRKQNRPYSAIDISSNLKNRVTKAAAAKLLKDMHERNEIEGRAAGKQLVYHSIQAEADEGAAQALQHMDSQTTHLRETTVALKNEEKELRIAIRDSSTRIPLPELRASVSALEQQKDGLTARLAILRGGDLEPVSLEDRAATDKEWEKWQKTSKARNNIRRDLWKEMEPHVPEDEREQFKESLGLDF